MLSPVLVTAATDTPVTVAEAKAHLVVDFSDDDTVIDAMISAAVDYLDGPSGILGRALCPQTWSQEYDCFSGDMVLPFGPVSSVTSVTYGDGDTFTDFRLLQDGRGWFLRPNAGVSWPSTDTPIVVEFVAGYTDVPEPIRAAILLHIGTLYEYRETSVEKWTPTRAYEALLAPYRAWRG